MFLRTMILFGLVLFSTHLMAAPVDVNTASAKQIAKSLKGVGLNKAAAIVQFRNDNGPFTSIDELKQVRGIGSKVFSSIKDDILIKTILE